MASAIIASARSDGKAAPVPVMVVIASMIGVQGLGLNVLQAIANQYFTQGIFNGFAIVGIAIIFDRISQAYGHRLQKHRGARRE